MLLFDHSVVLVTPWTIAPQAPLSMDFPGKNTEVGCHFLLQGIFLTQESNPGFGSPVCRWILYQLSHKESSEWLWAWRLMIRIMDAKSQFSSWQAGTQKSQWGSFYPMGEDQCFSSISQAKVLSYLAFWSSADWSRTTLILDGNPLYSALPI